MPELPNPLKQAEMEAKMKRHVRKEESKKRRLTAVEEGLLVSPHYHTDNHCSAMLFICSWKSKRGKRNIDVIIGCTL